jgi:hypothetical protein
MGPRPLGQRSEGLGVEPPPIPSNAANLTPWTKSNFLAVTSDELLSQPIVPDNGTDLSRAGELKTQPLPFRIRIHFGALRKVPNLLRSASPSARSPVLARPVFSNAKPSTSRVKQSITGTKTHEAFLPQSTIPRSVAHRRSLLQNHLEYAWLTSRHPCYQIT